jgi:hypothetical protein
MGRYGGRNSGASMTDRSGQSVADLSIAGRARQQWRVSVNSEVFSFRITRRAAIGFGLFFLALGIPLTVSTFFAAPPPWKVFGVTLPTWCSTFVAAALAITGFAFVFARETIQLDRSKRIVRVGYQLWRLWRAKQINITDDTCFVVNVGSEVAWGNEPSTYEVTALSDDSEVKVAQCNRTGDAIWLAEQLATFARARVIDATGNELDTYDPWEREHLTRAISDVAVLSTGQAIPEPPKNAKSSWSTVRDVPALRLPPGGWRSIKDELVYMCAFGAPFVCIALVFLFQIPSEFENEGLVRVSLSMILFIAVSGVIVYILFRVKAYHFLVFENDSLCVERRWGWWWWRRRFGYKELEAVVVVPIVQSFLENPPDEFSGIISIFDPRGSVRIGGSISAAEAEWIGKIIGAVAIARKPGP